jgi:hypothetical protein
MRMKTGLYSEEKYGLKALGMKVMKKIFGPKKIRVK